MTRFARAPDGVSIAYLVSGDGPLDLLFPSGFPLDLYWDEPGFVRFARHLGRFCRVVMSDQRGVGASGGDVRDSYVEEIHASDVAAVLDAVGCERAVLVGTDAGGPRWISYAAAHPERVRALVLVNTYARYLRADDYPWGVPPEALERSVVALAEARGTGATVDLIAPSKSGDEAFRRWFARSERLARPVDRAADGLRANLLEDVRGLLPTLTVPTLVLHRVGDRFIRVGAGRYLADHIPGAKYVELPGDDHLFIVGDTDGLLDEI